jgi:hypothetical protein
MGRCLFMPAGGAFLSDSRCAVEVARSSPDLLTRR